MTSLARCQPLYREALLNYLTLWRRGAEERGELPRGLGPPLTTRIPTSVTEPTAVLCASAPLR
jgi:hypothetical protein